MTITRKDSKRHFKKPLTRWLGRTAAVALVAGTATITIGAPRGDAEPRGSSPLGTRIVRLDPANGQTRTAPGDLRTDAARTRTHSITWQYFTRQRLVPNEPPNGMNDGLPDNTQTDAARERTHSITWRYFSRQRLVRNDPPNGMDGRQSGDIQVEPLRGGMLRPTLVYGLGRDGAGGVRAEGGLSFRFR